MFLAITLFLAAALGWLSWRLLQQDRALASQQAQERREIAADLAATALEKNLSALEEQLMGLVAGGPRRTPFTRDLSSDSVLVVLDPAGVEALPIGRLLYHPFLPKTADPPPGVFALADASEFLKGDYAHAIAALAEPSRSSNPAIRAEALTRIGRNYRKQGQGRAAENAFEQLRRMGSTPVSGLPAELVARDALCLMLEERKEGARLKSEAAELYAGLQSGRWPLSRGAYDFYTGEARRRARVSESPRQDSLALSEGAEALWREWESIRRGEGMPAGRRCLYLQDRPVLVVWRSSPGRLAGFIAGAGYLESRWMGALDSVRRSHGAGILLLDGDGRPVLGGSPKGRPAVRLASTTGLPWTLQAFTSEDYTAAPDFILRRRLLISGFCVMVLLVLAGSYFIARAVTREIAVARLQSDFVTAVSHEFRTPLTSLCQFTELLSKGRVDNDQRRQQFYAVLARESQRLRRLVEGLLNFGGMEAGAVRYNFKPLDPADLLQRVVDEFRQEAEIGSRIIRFRADGSSPPVRADREALSCVVWNLLDNAVKYSADGSTVEVDLTCNGSRLAIAVRDRGVGIPRDEQRKIFEKFVRGDAARSLSVRGAGIGLAIARRIARAHSGEIALHSEPGKGSVFTLFLPIAEES